MVRAGQKIGKYKLIRRLAEGGFANVYRARDTVEGVPVALKLLRGDLLGPSLLDDFRHEVRMTARLDHPNILLIKNADVVDGSLFIVYPLGKGSLEEQLEAPLPLPKAVDYFQQMLEALAHAHSRRIMHCDIKPSNFIVFDDDRLRLADFGVAKIVLKTRTRTAVGTVGYLAPEQAMGKPSLRSDCFSLGLVFYQMLTGCLPSWPFSWPPDGYQELKQTVHPDLLAFLRKALVVDERKRFRDAEQMLKAFNRIRPRVLAFETRRRHTGTGSGKRAGVNGNGSGHWQEIRFRQFRRRFAKTLQLRHECRVCGGPMSEEMLHCPWCQTGRRMHRQETSFPHRCSRCRRGMKSDWRFCPWCYGGAVGPWTSRTYSDRRYRGRCANKKCERRDLMPFMRYCPWCRSKVKKPWKIEGSRDRCSHCRWGVVGEFWSFCPWCSSGLD